MGGTNSSRVYSNYELDFLEAMTQNVILTKGTTDSSSSIFVDGFSNPLPKRPRSQTPIGMGGSNPGGNGNGNGGFSSDLSSGNSTGKGLSDPNSKVPYGFSRKKPKQSKVDPQIQDGIRVEVVNDQIVVRVIRDGRPYFIEELAVLKKFYHAPDFGVELPPGLDLDYVRGLAPKERIRYLSDPAVLPRKCLTEYMTKLAQHMMDPNTQIKAGTLGGEKRWDSDPVQGIHAYNSKTQNYIFFNNDNFNFQTGMKLKARQRIDLEHNDNIL